MKQKQSQSVDAYMSELRLALPECKYKNDADELLKDQFLFGILNKEIQDHLLGEISETDNSVKALYEARRVESKHKQRKMLGIVNPNALTTVDAIRAKVKKISREEKCEYCGRNHKRGKRNCPAYGKICNECGGENHFKNVSKSRNKGSRKGSNRDSERSRRRTRAKCNHRCDVHEICECCDDSTESGNATTEDLVDQVQSLFYH